MDWGDLPYFLAVARHGQLAQAAAAMHADPTTVGRRLRRLERDLGVRLFEQTSEGQILTPAGRRLLSRVEGMATLAAQGEAASRREADIAGSIRISVAEGFGTWFISRHLGDFAKRYPALEIDLVANSGFLSPSRRETDLAILLARPRKGPLVARKLTDYQLRFYAARSYLDQHGPIDRIDALNTHRIIGYVPDIVYAPELRYLDELPLAAHATLRSSSINAQHQLVAAGAGIGMLPCFIADSDPRLAAILPPIRVMRSFWLTSHRDTRGFAQVKAMNEWLLDLVSAQRSALTGNC
ncbi:LysR family transcriptional regulator [Stakelama sp. CBK3Z-3]|uniref:LysR family transcriptional regulator n=1 Tax=Stakelama flava TaxID=2860338 RepID=A0ABS6XGV4_9SPHN|nr:LysR substrate-binding domain-containing protein [Stakelama flava]MBW4329440.1 LysR family transcriptional regulator [Stakelama flava]